MDPDHSKKAKETEKEKYCRIPEWETWPRTGTQAPAAEAFQAGPVIRGVTPGGMTRKMLCMWCSLPLAKDDYAGRGYHKTCWVLAVQDRMEQKAVEDDRAVMKMK